MIVVGVLLKMLAEVDFPTTEIASNQKELCYGGTMVVSFRKVGAFALTVINWRIRCGKGWKRNE